MTDYTSIAPEALMGRIFDRLAALRLLDSYGMYTVHLDVDRAWGHVKVVGAADILRRFDQLEQADELDASDAGLHQASPAALDKLHADKATKIRCYRGRLPEGLAGDQWVIYRLYGQDVFKGLLIEFDVDPQSPVDIAGLPQHWWMCLKHWWTGGKTSAVKTAEALKKAGIAV